MEVFMATENINRFASLLAMHLGFCEKRALLDLLRREEEKLATAIAAQEKLLTAAAS